MTPLTIDEIRDQIAEWEGWEKRRRFVDPALGGLFPLWVRGNDILIHGNHPIPYTLDEAAKLPDSCRGCETIHVGLSNTVAVIVAGPLTGTRTEAPTEIEARFRLRHAAMKAERGIA